MGKNYIESSLKRFLKRKVKITLGVVVSFLITGMVSLGAESTAEEGSTQWHKEQAQKYLAGIKDGTGITIDKDIAIENVTISSDNAGGIKVTFSDKEIVITKDIISTETKKVIQECLNTALKKEEIIEKNNYSILTGMHSAQSISKGEVGNNYGIIVNEGSNGQDISTGIGNNYGIIANKGNVGQKIQENGIGNNYGIIANKGHFGQNASAGKAYNYGVIANTESAGQIVDEGKTGELYNYGIIANGGNNGITNRGTGKAENYGVIKNTTGKVFEGNVNNYGIIILTNENKQTIGSGGLGTGENKGVVLTKDYALLDQELNGKKVNAHVTDLTNSGKIDGTENETYYVKDKNIEFKNDLTGNVLTAVVTSENKNPVFKYTGDDKLTLKNSSVMGYFLASGTLLDIQGGKELELVNSKINTVVGFENGTDKITAVNLNGGILTQVGESDIAGKVVGKGTTKYISVHSNNQNVALENGNITLTNTDDTSYGLSKTNTEVTFNTIKADNLNLEFTVDTNKDVNKVTLNNAELKSIDGSSSTEKIDLTINNIENIGNITLGQNDDIFTTTNGTHNGIIDMGDNATDGDTFNVLMGAVGTEHHKEAGNTFDYKVNGAEKIVLNGEGWHIGENAELNGGTTAKAGEKTTLHIADNGSLHVDMNNNYGKGNVSTSLDKMASRADLSVTTGKDAEVKFVVGDKFNVSDKQFEVAHNYSVKGANLGTAVIFKGTGTDGAVEEKDGKIALTVKEASEIENSKGQTLANYKGIYDTMLGALSSNEDLRAAVNYSDANNLVDMVVETNNTASAFYTTGYAVTKDVTDTYMSIVDDFGRKAGAGEWIAYGKYVNSDTEFDGGKASKGYDGDITGTVGMIEYGVNDTTSYGAVFGKGDTKVDINGGGKLDGDNTYAGLYMKHKTQTGIDLTANVGYTKSDLDLNLATSASNYNMITDGSSDSTALTFALKGTKDYKLSESMRLQPVVSARYSLINQDAVESKDANFRIDEQDVTIFEGAFGGNVIKDFDVYNGTLSLKAGAEFVLTKVSKSDDGRYTLYGKDITLIDEEDIADNRIRTHVGAEYIHENGVGIDAKYEMIFTDKGDTDRITAGVSYKF